MALWQRLATALEIAVRKEPQEIRLIKKIVFFLQGLLVDSKLFRIVAARTQLVHVCTTLIGNEDVEVAELSGKVLQAIANEEEGKAKAKEVGTLDAVKKVQERGEKLTGEEKQDMESCLQRLGNLRLVLQS